MAPLPPLPNIYFVVTFQVKSEPVRKMIRAELNNLIAKVRIFFPKKIVLILF